MFISIKNKLIVALDQISAVLVQKSELPDYECELKFILKNGSTIYQPFKTCEEMNEIMEKISGENPKPLEKMNKPSDDLQAVANFLGIEDFSIKNLAYKEEDVEFLSEEGLKSLRKWFEVIVDDAQNDPFFLYDILIQKLELMKNHFEAKKNDYISSVIQEVINILTEVMEGNMGERETDEAAYRLGRFLLTEVLQMYEA